jgi:hypothetical protein
MRWTSERMESVEPAGEASPINVRAARIAEDGFDAALELYLRHSLHD